MSRGKRHDEDWDDMGPLPYDETRRAILGLVGAMNAAADQAGAMTDAELGSLLLDGHWTTIEIHEAGRRLLAHHALRGSPTKTEGS